MNVRAGFERLYETLVGSSQSQKCDASKNAVTKALANLEAAELRGDTRSIGLARMVLCEARTDQLRAELGR